MTFPDSEPTHEKQGGVGNGQLEVDVLWTTLKPVNVETKLVHLLIGRQSKPCCQSQQPPQLSAQALRAPNPGNTKRLFHGKKLLDFLRVAWSPRKDAHF